MAHGASPTNEGPEALSPQQARTDTTTMSDLDEGAYPSSESDADGPVSQSQPLLAPAEHAHRPTAPSAETKPAPVSGRTRRTQLKWTEVIWVTFTLALIATLGYSSQLCIMLPYYHKTPSFSLKGLAAVLVPFNLGLLGIFYNYYLCVFTDPGTVPKGWEPEWSALDPVAPPPTAQSGLDSAALASESEPSIELKQAIYRPRFCKTCSAFKPPRSHHCKTCHRCVLRMDHHCPWLANCVGHYNYPHFIRFLFYVDVTCAYHLAMITARVLDKFNSYSYWREPGTRELVWLVVNYALCIPVILLVGIFSGYHFYCTTINQTTIEGWEKDRTATMVRRGRIRKIKYPYSLGWWRNCQSVLGSNPVWWCVPGARAETMGDGLKFPVADGLDEGAQYRWPPKDPAKSSSSPYSTHGWRADGSEAPALFSGVAPPGAAGASPFTYGGGGFNPRLQPTNSATLRRRGTAGITAPVGEDDGEEDSSVSTDSDDDEGELTIGQGVAQFVEPTAADLARAHGYASNMSYGGYGQYGQYEQERDYAAEHSLNAHHDDGADEEHDEEAIPDDEEVDEDDEGATRVRIRRGSEGYEVRPRAWVV